MFLLLSFKLLTLLFNYLLNIDLQNLLIWVYEVKATAMKSIHWRWLKFNCINKENLEKKKMEKNCSVWTASFKSFFVFITSNTQILIMIQRQLLPEVWSVCTGFLHLKLVQGVYKACKFTFHYNLEFLDMYVSIKVLLLPCSECLQNTVLYYNTSICKQSHLFMYIHKTCPVI